MKLPRLQLELKSFNLGIIALSAFLFFSTVAVSLLSISENAKTSVLDASPIQTESLPASYEQWIKAGNTHFENRELTDAIDAYEEAKDSDPSRALAYAKLAEVLLSDYQIQAALENAKTAHEKEPNNANYIALYGRSLIENGHFESAREILGRAPNNQSALFLSAQLYAFFDQDRDAQTKFEEAASINGEIPPFQIESFRAAYQKFEAQQDGDRNYLHALLAEAFNQAETYRLAKDLLIRALNEKNDYRDLWILLGYAELKSKAYAQAEDALNQAVYLDPLRPESHYFLGMAHFLQNDFTPAARSFELALLHGFKPEVEAYRKLAESYLSSESYTEALETYEHLLTLDQSDITLFINPIWISLSVNNDLDRALSLAEQSVERFPSHAQSHSLLAWVQIKRSELEEAAKSINTAFALDRELPDNYYNAGLLEEARNNTEKAKVNFKRAYDLADPSSIIKEMAATQYNNLLQTPSTSL